jgi:hypothetical protein
MVLVAVTGNVDVLQRWLPGGWEYVVVWEHPPPLAVCGEPTNLTIVHRFWTPINLIKFIGTEESKKSNQCSIDLLTCSVHAVMLLGPRYYRAQMGLAN